MKIGGPFPDPQRKTSKKRWYLSYFVPRIGATGAPETDATGKVMLKRERPYYETKQAAEEDKPRILAQYRTSGGGSFVRSREAQAEYEEAKRIVGTVSLVAAAKYYRDHHPLGDSILVPKAVETHLAKIKALHGETRHHADLSSRLTMFAKVYPTRPISSFSKVEILAHLRTLNKGARTVLNQKRAICSLFNGMIEDGVVTTNPAGGIKKRQLPKIFAKEIQFLHLVDAQKYLRAFERFDPDLVAYEVVQFFAGVRSDDEMGNFLGEWVLADTKEIVIPAEIAKTGVREVINGIEENFWEWWARYGRKGLLRLTNYEMRWKRIRVLSAMSAERAMTASKLPIKTLLEEPGSAEILAENWPWNARRRTFCTYHVAKYQSADKTQLILRQRGAAETLFNSYRGLGVTQAQGVAFFDFKPRSTQPASAPPLP